VGGVVRVRKNTNPKKFFISLINLHIREQLDQVTSILRSKNLPKDLQIKIRKYLEFVWEQEISESPEQENLLMSKLSSNLRDEVFLHTNVKYLTSVKCFSIFDQKTLIKLASFMRKVRYSPEEFIFRVKNFI
jgi:hypothetical protein